jgi:hypothetical protein
VRPELAQLVGTLVYRVMFGSSAASVLEIADLRLKVGQPSIDLRQCLLERGVARNSRRGAGLCACGV